ncbi:helix-turn-helix domain-containing protein [Psychromarinibacter sp. C21-152]|uniref:Helix-turn-helix domain-containing protein n=1 Tax=Psychromarinibacter sediminicola TaxID=3033385 RepID=A0AAE3NS98_9RHOB|nr:transcriptional regulator [Psychromarinibacter sediminicola]MDF0601081.1 helix-turn-helix domain-containing protein [Psychromarinibacter sediminicola]
MRHLRGESTQAEFAERLGLTRSALANYENGRTKPKPSLLREISRKLGISEDFLLSGQVRNEYELNLVVTGRGMLNESHTTHDEEAILRLLRAIPPNYVKEIVEKLLELVELKPEVRERLNGPGIETDLALLAEIYRKGGVFDKGQHPLEAEEWLERYAKLARSEH